MTAMATGYQRTFHGRPDQVAAVRADAARVLAGYPVKDDAVLIVSELATNALLHSDSAGEFFTVRMEFYPSYIWLEVEDLGGGWQVKGSDGRHGLDIVTALAGGDNWGVEPTHDGDRVVWVRLVL